MTVFELLFLAVFVVSVITVIVGVYASIRGQRAAAISIFKRWTVGAGFYLAVSLTVSFLKPQRIIAVGDPWCFDDWCLTAENVSRTVAPPDATYTVNLRVFSRAHRVSQRARNAWIYLRDENDRHYLPEPADAATALDVELEPGQSVSTVRIFKIPAEVHHFGLVTGHGGGPCSVFPSLLIIGEGGCLFHKQTMIRLQ